MHPLPHAPSWHSAYLVKHRDNFTFILPYPKYYYDENEMSKICSKHEIDEKLIHFNLKLQNIRSFGEPRFIGKLLERINSLLSFHDKLKVGLGMDRIKNTECNSSPTVACVFITAEPCLQFYSNGVSSSSTIPDFRRQVTLLPPWGWAAVWEAVMLALVMGEISEVRGWDGLRFHDIYAKFHEDWFRHSKVVTEDTHTGTQTARWSHKLIFISQNMESRLKWTLEN
jgi:hypothetical protein